MTFPLLRPVSVYLDPIHAGMQVLRPITGGRRSSVGDIHLLRPPLGERGWIGAGKGSSFGAWISVYCGVGVLGWRVSGRVMCGLLSALLSISNRRADILGRLMPPASSSTLMHQVLSSRVRRRRKLIDRISYSASQSTFYHLSLALCSTRERRSATRGWVSYHRVTRMAVWTSAEASAGTQSTWYGPLSTASSCKDSFVKGQMLPLNMLSQSLALAHSFLDDAVVCVMNRKVLSPTVREA